MKKIILLFLVLNFCIFKVDALEKNRKEVNLIKCEDAVSSFVNIDGVKTRIRLIAVDTSDGELNNEIDDYVCNLLNDAKKIEIEYEPNFKDKDEYNRVNVWVYADSILLQKDLIEKGYAQVNYVKGNYMYLNDLCNQQKETIKNNLGIWSYPNQEEKYCNSGIKIGDSSSNEVEEEKEVEEKDYTYLYDMICLILFIITLSLIIRFKRSNNE